VEPAPLDPHVPSSSEGAAPPGAPEGAGSRVAATGSAPALDDALPEGTRCAAHREDAVFVCARCGSFGCAACRFSAVAGREICAACAGGGLEEPIPWERRAELGKWTAFWRTTKLAVLSPVRFFKTPTTSPSGMAAVAHGVGTYTVGMMLSYALSGLTLLLGGGVLALVGEDTGLQELGGVLGVYGCAIVGMSPLALLFGPANALMGLVFGTACAHGTLALFGKARGSFEDSLRAMSYSNAPRVLFFVPVLGILAWGWMLRLEVVGLRETHGCGTDWAAAATFGYRVALVLVTVLAYAAIFGFAYLSAQPGRLG
jgi:hypothetical protein